MVNDHISLTKKYPELKKNPSTMSPGERLFPERTRATAIAAEVVLFEAKEGGSEISQLF